MPLKILSINLWNGGYFYDNIIAFIQKEYFDVICMQEVFSDLEIQGEKHYHTLDQYLSILPYQYHTFAPAITTIKPEGKYQSGNAILSKIPLQEHETIFFDPYSEINEDEMKDFSSIGRNLQHVSIEVSEKRLDIFNTQGIWGFDDRDNEKRSRMSHSIIQALDGYQNAIVTGDFNVGQDTQAISQIEQILVNPFKGQMTTSFNLNIKKGGGFATSVVDYFFVSPSIKIVHSYSPNEELSDHLTLVVELDV
jgi:endonuclease/exonuclease/phosphatase family metal-dependent hydrolase